MKTILSKALGAAVLLGLCAVAEEPKKEAPAAQAPDKSKVSYALGMNLGLQRKRTDADVDIQAFAQGLSDVLDGKPTQISETEIVSVLNEARDNRLNERPERQRQKVGYALGMRMGGQLKRVGAEVETAEVAAGLKDVMEGKPTRIKESEIEPLFEQAKAYGVARQSEQNRSEGQMFLAKNSKQPGISVLPDGLQYRVLKTGDGEIPGTNDLIIVKYRGSFVNGKEFDRKEHFLTRSNGGISAWQDALQRMRVGSKWQLFVPPDLGFGQEGEPAHQIGADATLIYELELVSIARPGDPLIGTGTLGHGLDGELESAANTK